MSMADVRKLMQKKLFTHAIIMRIDSVDEQYIHIIHILEYIA